jgi:hypothetical protein
MSFLLAPQKPKDRFEVYRFFNGLSAEGKEGLDRSHSRVPLVKSFLLEHVSSQNGRTAKSPQQIFQELGTELVDVDEKFFGIRSPEKENESASPVWATIGFVEQYDERFFAYYTVEKSEEARKRVTRWITRSHDLDATWFSSQLLQALWDRDVKARGDHRFVKLVFRHDSIYEMPADAEHTFDGELEEDGDDAQGASDDVPELERRKARFEMGDRIGRIKKSLSNLQENYYPLYALFALRFPSQLGHGSHDLFQQGQITNRSDSFEDHRNTVRYLYRAYKAVLDQTEEVAWSHREKPPRSLALQVGTRGVPLIVRFKEELSRETFQRWVSLAFQKKNRFRLWGNPIELGPTKVQVYGADRHLWQPINLELTAGGLTAILPEGTCGNTFHRLVTNIQRYVCPKIEAWLGAKPFDSLMDAAAGKEAREG